MTSMFSRSTNVQYETAELKVCQEQLTCTRKRRKPSYQGLHNDALQPQTYCAMWPDMCCSIGVRSKLSMIATIIYNLSGSALSFFSFSHPSEAATESKRSLAQDQCGCPHSLYFHFTRSSVLFVLKREGDWFLVARRSLRKQEVGAKQGLLDKG